MSYHYSHLLCWALGGIAQNSPSHVLYIGVSYSGYCFHGMLNSTLHDRYQSTLVMKSLSSPGLVSSGVPQGSILGSLLFIRYINDHPNILEYSSAHIYTTALLVTGKDPMEINYRLNKDAANVTQWFNQNKLLCNTKKTKTVLSSNVRYIRKYVPLEINVNDSCVEELKVIKYLGVLLDCHLNFESHAASVASIVNNRICLLW